MPKKAAEDGDFNSALPPEVCLARLRAGLTDVPAAISVDAEGELMNADEIPLRREQAR